MSLHRQAPKRDACEPGIVRALTAIGCAVQLLTGKGVPDLLVAYRGKLVLLEVKGPLGPRGGSSGRDLTPDQEAWMSKWPTDVWVVRTADDAIAAVREALNDEREAG